MRARWIQRMASATVLAAAGVFSGSALAAVPGTITHQERLYDSANLPVVGTIDVLFAVYDTPAATVPSWSELHHLTFDSGYYSASLGRPTPRSTSRVRSAGTNRPTVPRKAALTETEHAVAYFAAVGHSHKLIGYELGFSTSAVAHHLRSALLKLGLRSRIELARLYGQALQ